MSRECARQLYMIPPPAAGKVTSGLWEHSQTAQGEEKGLARRDTRKENLRDLDGRFKSL